MRKMQVLAAILMLSVMIPLSGIAAGGEIIKFQDGRQAVTEKDRLYLLDKSGNRIQTPAGTYLTRDGKQYVVDSRGVFTMMPVFQTR